MSRKPALALAALALLALAVPVLGRPGWAAAAQQRPAAGSRADCTVPVSILCLSASPSPTPSGGSSPNPAPTPSASASASADPTPSPSGSGSASASPSPSPSPSGASSASPRPRRSNSAKASSVKAAAPSGLMITEAQFVLSTGSALLLGASYQGVAQVPTASGSTVPMMKFTMTSLTLQGSPTLSVTQSGVTSQTSGTSMQFTGNVVLYATQLSGDLLGVPVTLTPASPLATILQLLNSVTPLVPLKLTNVTSLQPYISANSLQLPGLSETS